MFSKFRTPFWNPGRFHEVPVGVVEINNLERVKLYYIFLKTMNLTVNQRVAGSSPGERGIRTLGTF